MQITHQDNRHDVFKRGVTQTKIWPQILLQVARELQQHDIGWIAFACSTFAQLLHPRTLLIAFMEQNANQKE